MSQQISSDRNWIAKVFQFPLTRIVLGCAIVILAMLASNYVSGKFFGKGAPDTLPRAALSTAMILCAYAAFVRFIERRPMVELARTGALKELALGVAIGGVLLSATVGTLWALGYYKVAGFNPASAMLPIFYVSVVAAVVEELLLRAIVFRIVEQSLGTVIGVLLSGLLFGMLHISNQGATIWSSLAIALEAGVLLAAAFTCTRRMWLVFGIHFAWNFTQGGIFGVAISGNASNGWIKANIVGPELMTGGAFGAEAGLPAVLLCTSAGIVLLWLAHRRGQFILPFWKRAA